MQNEFECDFEALHLSCIALGNVVPVRLLKSHGVYIYGAGKFGRHLANILKAKGFEVLGFFDSARKSGVVDGLPIFSIDNFSHQSINAQLAIGIFNRDVPLDLIKRTAIQMGFKNIFMPWDVYDEFEQDFGWKYWLGSRRLIIDNISKLRDVFVHLSDSISHQALIDICRFRLGLNDSYASFKNSDPQYFNSLTLALFLNSKPCTYVDCGAYNGDTLTAALKHLCIENAYLFEPDINNYTSLVKAVRTLGVNAICFPLATSDRYAIASFNSDGEGGSVMNSGATSIALSSLDQVLGEKHVDFIKIDVEGSECAALSGARKLIERARPVLAISLYHHPQDLWEIPSMVMKYCTNYSFYIRQHYYNSFDCVLYAIPNDCTA